jgi:hypothetical protein
MDNNVMAAANPKKKVNRRERIGGAVYVLIFAIAGVFLSAWLLFSGSDVARLFSAKDAIEMKMHRQQSFNTRQEETAALCEMLTQKISEYDPGVNAVYEKSDIQYLINELRARYEENISDKRYLVFLHMSDFYQMWFNDRERLWSLTSNQIFLQGNLDECELGLEKKNGATGKN